MNASVGPLTARPPTSGLTATTGAGAAAIASRIPGTARIGPIEITGFEGPTITTSALGDRRQHLGGRARVGDPLELDASIGASPWSRIRNSCSPRQPAGVRTRVRTRLLAHRQDRARDAERARDLRLGGGQGAALGDEVGPVEAGGEVAVGEPEPAGRAELLEALVDGEGVVADAPAALLVDLRRRASR